MPGLHQIAIKNFRCLKNVAISLESVNVLFGPNGAGKSTILDAIRFIHDSVVRGVDIASSNRSHGIGVRWREAMENDCIAITLNTGDAEYEINFGFSSGRIEPFIGERLSSQKQDYELIKRLAGSDRATLFHGEMEEPKLLPLREPEKPALSRYVLFDKGFPAAYELHRLISDTSFYHVRSLDLHGLKTRGSESSPTTLLGDRCQNLWSVLRNLKDRKELDPRYDIIMSFMKKSFPGFVGVLLEQTGPNSVYASFLLSHSRDYQIQASGISDGHLTLLALLTALFSSGKKDTLILLDEPETSLHPHALAILAEAINLAATEWRQQILIATHSPVLLSQFSPDQVLAATPGPLGETNIHRLSEMVGVQDLLDQYAAGSLYMAEMIAPQSETRDEVELDA